MHRTSISIFLLLVFSLFLTDETSASERQLTAAEADGRLVSRLHILGLKRTRETVVRSELMFAERDILRAVDVQESILRLRNTRLFSLVEMSLVADQDDSVQVTIRLQEKWTTIPIFKFTSGGNTTYLVAGVYDINTLGRYVETGAQYESWNEQPGGVMWFRDPRFLGYRLRFGGDVWSTKRPQELYDQRGESQGRFVLRRQRLNLFVDYEFQTWLTAGVGVDYNRDNFLSAEPDNLLMGSNLQQLEAAEQEVTSFLRFYLKLGRVNYDNYLLQGGEIELTHEHASSKFGSDHNVDRIVWDNRYYWRVAETNNLAARVRLGSTNSSGLQHVFYVGGFENIRGYYDGQFRGRHFWQTNVEFRVPMYRGPWVVWQANVFADAARVHGLVSDAQQRDSDLFYSTGIGVRLISPRVYRFIGRLDVALATSHEATSRVSFGVQQFF